MIEIPLRIESTLNKREHWAMRSRRASKQRESTVWALKASPTPSACIPAVVKLTRIAPRELDTDNLAGGFKSVRDGVADWLGIKDNDERVEWVYAQRRGKPKQYAVEIEFEPEQAPRRFTTEEILAVGRIGLEFYKSHAKGKP